MKFEKLCSAIKSYGKYGNCFYGTLDIFEGRAAVALFSEGEEVRFQAHVEGLPAGYSVLAPLSHLTFSRAKVSEYLAVISQGGEPLSSEDAEWKACPERPGAILPAGTVKNFIDAVQKAAQPTAKRHFINDLFIESKGGRATLMSTTGKAMSFESFDAPGLPDRFCGISFFALGMLKELLSDKKTQFCISFGESAAENEVSVYSSDGSAMFSYKGEISVPSRGEPSQTFWHFYEKGAGRQALLNGESFQALLACMKDMIESPLPSWAAGRECVRLYPYEGCLCAEKLTSSASRVVAQAFDAPEGFEGAFFDPRVLRPCIDFFRKEGKDAYVSLKSKSSGIVLHSDSSYAIAMPIVR